MKIKLKHSTHGSVLLVTLLTATIIGIALASYLALVSNQNLSVTRSLAWNSVMPVVESGVEEALSQIFYNSYTNLSANSWTLSATDGLYHKTRTVGTDGSYYEVSISPVDPPVIVSKGYVVPPVRDYSQLGMILATAVGGSPSGATPTYVCRTVQVKTQKMRGSGVGLTAKDFISFSGGSLDSYSSADGPYNATNHHAGGKAVSNSKLANAIQVGTAHIYGSASTGAGGTVTVAGGSVGDLTWYPGNTGVQAGSTSDTASVEFFDESAPFTSGFLPVTGSYPVGGTNYAWQLGDGNYKYTGNLQFSAPAVVTGHAVLYVTGKFTISGGTTFIYIAPGASLEIYAGTEFVLSGGGILNPTQNPALVKVHGLNTCTKGSITGGSQFFCTVSAPYAAITISGGTTDVFGSFIGNSFTITGGAEVHYDEALDTSGNGYVVSCWNEIHN